MRRLMLILCFVMLGQAAQADKDAYLEVASRGWNYDLRTTMIGRDMSIPVRISGQTLKGAAICIVGDAPRPDSRAVLTTFSDLIQATLGKRLTMRYAGPSARGCGTGRMVVLRLYSGFPPNDALSDDLGWLSETYDLGLPPGRFYAATSPAIGQTFFGRRGQGTHIMVQQSGAADTHSDAAYFRSILVEELFQVFTFGMDILQFDRKAAFLSKLQEYPYRAPRVSWESQEFKRLLLATNPSGLCDFDVLMLHAIANAEVEQTNSDAFIAFVDSEFDRLSRLAATTLADPRFALILDRACAPTLR